MNKENLTIQEASKISGKSVQTIRRAIKAKKIKYRRMKTPQGFNYLVNRSSLLECYGIAETEKESAQATQTTKDTQKEEAQTATEKKAVSKVMEETDEAETAGVSREDFRQFTVTLERMVSQHAEERQNFLRLVNSLQEKIFVLENQINLLKAPEKKWFHFWK